MHAGRYQCGTSLSLRRRAWRSAIVHSAETTPIAWGSGRATLNSGRVILKSGRATLALSLLLIFQVAAIAAEATLRPATPATPVATSVDTPAKRSRDAREADDFGLAQVRLINDAIRQGWSDHQLVPSPAASDGEWCRRVYLDLIGRVPTVEELEKYTSDKKRDKRARLVELLPH